MGQGGAGRICLRLFPPGAIMQGVWTGPRCGSEGQWLSSFRQALVEFSPSSWQAVAGVSLSFSPC